MKEPAKSIKKSPIKEEFSEQLIDSPDPFILIDGLSESNFSRVLQALKGLKQFVRKNLLFDLLDKALLEKIMYLVQDKKSTNEIIELSIELLSELFTFKTVIDRIAEENEMILYIFNLFKTKSVDIQVQCLKSLSSLTKVKTICELLAENCDLNLLFVRVNQKDPDVQANILKVLYNLFQADIVIAEQIVNLPGFSYSPLLNLLSSDYPIVQHRSLNLITWLTSYDHISVLREIFIEENGVHFLIKTLETHKWPDMHEKVFTILYNLSQLSETFNKLGDAGIKMLVDYVNNIESQKLQFASYNTILKMTKQSSHGLQLFVNNDLYRLVMNFLNDDDNGGLMYKLSVTGVAVLSENAKAMTLMEEDPNLIQAMFNVLNSKNTIYDWSVRLSAATSIYLMTTKSKILFKTLMEHQYWATILELLTKFNQTAPYEMTLLLANILKRIILDVYKSIDCPSKKCGKLIHVLKTLMMDPQSSRVELKCAATEMIEELVEFPEFRNVLRQMKVYRSMAKLMFRTNENVSILEAYLKLFITLIEWDPIFIDELNYVHAIDWFITKRGIHQTLPIARRFLDFLFDKCKYIKIHFTNRLEPWDKIQSGFYVQRAYSDLSHFKSLRTFILEKYLKSRPVYYIDFGEDLEEMNKKRFRASDTASYCEVISMITMDTDTIENQAECSFNDLEVLQDPFLILKLQELKALLGYPQEEKIILNLREVLNREEYMSKVTLLAEYVCKLLNEINEVQENCQNHSFELHLSEIKEDLQSAVIPLGRLRLGTKFERALLFKALGDQVGIPSAFVRGYCGNGWNEIYLTPSKDLKEDSTPWMSFSKDKNAPPKRLTIVARKSVDVGLKQTAVSQSMARKSALRIEKRLSKKSLPNTKSFAGHDLGGPQLPPLWHQHAYQAYMKTNYVIDLDKNPGNLYQIGSVEAGDYTSKLAPVHPYFFYRTNIPPLIKNKLFNT